MTNPCSLGADVARPKCVAQGSGLFVYITCVAGMLNVADYYVIR